MKRLLLGVLAIISFSIAKAQLLTWTPDFPTENNPSQTLVITVDAAKGNKGLLNYTPTDDVYVHIGVITNKSASAGDWKYVKESNFSSTSPVVKANYIGNNKWTYTIQGSLRTFFNVTDPTETIQKIAILFRNGAGTKKQANIDNGDMYIPVYTNDFAVRLNLPAKEPKFNQTPEPQTWTVGTSFSVQGVSNKPATIKLYHNETVIASATNVQTLSANSSVTQQGLQKIVVEASDGTTTKYDTVDIFVAPTSAPIAELPSGVKDGINYDANGTSVTLVLHAPGKNLVTVIGDFNNWTEGNNFIMNKTPDGQRFWLRINGLTAGTEYGFQYKVDNSIKIADPYAEKILDPNNDRFITSATYPNLKPYPTGQTGMVGVLQTSAPAYTWAENNFNKPDKRNLIIYELLIRDFIANHDWNTLRDTLNYFKRLGINAIEVMPFNEFEGNNSWGYNGFQYFAPDKYYGPKNDIKRFIDSCHKYGIAVIMDIVLNHTYGPSPLAQLYWNSAQNRPAADNPWYNPVQPHAFGFGEDFNHESQATKNFFNRVLQHWITEYKIDGYRIDFSKGLTQKPSTNDAQFSAYDASRIAIINGYASSIKAVDANAYVILEHLTDNSEERELANSGILLWGNLNHNYSEAAMGYVASSDLSWGVHTARGYSNPHLVTYMESHDEERVTYKALKYGYTSPTYNIKDTATALERMELNAAFLFTIPGPKMFWQFGELGYDISRCYLSSNNDESGNCDQKLSPKPIRWDYLQDSRRQEVFETYSSLIKLRSHPSYINAFKEGAILYSLSNSDTIRWIKLTTDTSKLIVVGNFGVRPSTRSISFPEGGTWYDYLNNQIFNATGTAQNITLQPGEYHVYLNRNVNNITATPVINVRPNENALHARLFPNPAKDFFVLQVTMPQAGNVSIEVYNTIGQYVTTLKQSFLNKGEHQLTFNKKSLNITAGNYYLKIGTKTENKTVQLTIQ